MTQDEKIKWVRDKVYEQEKLAGMGIATYPLEPVEQHFVDIFSELESKGTSVIVMTVGEQIDILRRLEREKLIRVMEQRENHMLLEVFPRLPTPIKLKTLEHIAKALADIFTGSQIVDILLDYGIPRCDIPYPNTKWFTLREMFLLLVTSPNPEQQAKFGGAITTFLHPLNFNADEEVSLKLIADFNKYLKYDGYEITAADDGNGYRLCQTSERTKVSTPVKSPAPVQVETKKTQEIHPTLQLTISRISDENLPEQMSDTREYSEQVEYETSMLREPKSSERLAVVREAYKTLMVIVSSFCADPATPSRELNAAYTELTNTIAETLAYFCGDTSEFSIFSFDEYQKNRFGIPFGSLYTAELDFKKSGRKMHWDEIRPEMNAVLGQIEEVCQTANSPDVISEPKIQKIISDAMLLLSEIAAKRKNELLKSDTPIKMEITAIPELRIKNTEESVLVKNKKRITLPKFPRTEWSKVSVHFLSERDILLSDGKDTKPADYKSLGFEDERTSKPDMAWDFLLSVAKGNGETETLLKSERETAKKRKQKVADTLRKIYKNQTDPFDDFFELKKYRALFKIIPPPTEEAVEPSW